MDSSTDGSGVDPPASRPDMPSVMAAKVFDVPELREHIILSLSEHNILTSTQRVSRAWKASVDASPHIQRKLLLRTGPESAATPIRFFMAENYIEEVPIYNTAVEFNGLLKKASRLLPGCEIDGHPEPIGLWPSSNWHIHHEIEVGGKADGNPAFSDRSDRSWRKMQVCDPPISVVSLFTRVLPHELPGVPYPDEDEPVICAAVLDRDGVTMGFLYDTAAAMLRGTDSSCPFFRMSFGIDIPNELPQTNDAGDSDDGSDGGDGGGGEDRRGQGDDRDQTGHGSSSNGDDEEGDDHGGYGSAWNAQVNRIMDSLFSGRSRALAIPELLENIISFLPEREILTNAQRVSRTWRTSVAESPRIQRQLFLPKGKKPVVSPMRFTDDNLWGEMSEDFGIPIYKQSVVSNHLLKSADHVYADYPPADNGYTCYSMGKPAGDFQEVHHFWVDVLPYGQPAFSHNPDLSWRSMQLCDPPITVPNLNTGSGGRFGHSGAPNIWAMLFDRDGITMGLAYDTAVAALRCNLGEQEATQGWWFGVMFGIHEDA